MLSISMNTTREKKKTTMKSMLEAMNHCDSVILCLSSRHLKFMQKLLVSETKLPTDSATGNWPVTMTKIAPNKPTV